MRAKSFQACPSCNRLFARCPATLTWIFSIAGRRTPSREDAPQFRSRSRNRQAHRVASMLGLFIAYGRARRMVTIGADGCTWGVIFIVSLIRGYVRALSYVALPATIRSWNFRQRERPDSPLATQHHQRTVSHRRFPPRSVKFAWQRSSTMLLRVPQGVATADLRCSDWIRPHVGLSAFVLTNP